MRTRGRARRRRGARRGRPPIRRPGAEVTDGRPEPAALAALDAYGMAATLEVVLEAKQSLLELLPSATASAARAPLLGGARPIRHVERAAERARATAACLAGNPLAAVFLRPAEGDEGPVPSGAPAPLLVALPRTEELAQGGVEGGGRARTCGEAWGSA